jgi:hypothetical protein
MAKARQDHEEPVKRANPLVVFAKAMGLLTLVLAVLGVIWYILRSGGAFDPGPRERVTRSLPRLRPGLDQAQVRALLDKPRETTAKEFVELLARSGIDHSRIRLTASPAFQSGARDWEPPVNQTFQFRTEEQGANTQGHLLIRESELKFDKDGNWSFQLGDLITLDGQRLGSDPAKGPGAAGKGKDPSSKALVFPKGPQLPKVTTPIRRIDHWLYYFRAIQRPKTDEGPVQFLVLLQFEEGSLTAVLRCDVDVRGLPRPDGGTFAK